MSCYAWWYYSLGCIHSYYFHWPWVYFKVTALFNNFNVNYYVLIWISWNFAGLLNMSSRSWIHLWFYVLFCTHLRELIDIFLRWRCTSSWLPIKLHAKPWWRHFWSLWRNGRGLFGDVSHKDSLVEDLLCDAPFLLWSLPAMIFSTCSISLFSMTLLRWLMRLIIQEF